MVFLRFTLLCFFTIGLLITIYSKNHQLSDNQYLIKNNIPSVAGKSTDVFVNQSKNYYLHAVSAPQSANPPQDDVITADDAAETNENTSVSIKILDNDTNVVTGIDETTVDLDVSSPSPDIQNTLSVPGGYFEVDGDGIVTFSPSLNFSGSVTISYTVNDNLGIPSNQSSITVVVNDSPSALNDVANLNENTTTTINIVSNDTDSDGSIVVSTVDIDMTQSGIQDNYSTALEGLFEVSSLGVITFTPVTDFHGDAIISYTVQDNKGAVSNIATVTFHVNDAPIALNDDVLTHKNSTLVFSVVTNDTDSDGTVNASKVDVDLALPGVQSFISTAWGTFTVSTAGIVTYVPASNYIGTFALPYTVLDNMNAVSNEAFINMRVNDPPVANNDGVNANENIAVVFKVTTNDTDTDGTLDVTTIDLNTTAVGTQSSNSTAQGLFEADPLGNVTFTPAPNYNGTATLNYTVKDNDGASSNIATIIVSVNNSPVANNDAANTNENTAVNVTVITNDTDSDGSVVASSVDLDLTASGIQDSHTTPEGVFSVNTSGVVNFTPATDYHGIATLSYTVNDNKGATSNAATITITVNDAPVAGDDNSTTQEDIAVSFSITANDTDSDGSIVLTTIDLDPSAVGNQSTRTTPQGVFTVNTTTGVLSYSPALNFSGTAVVGYTIRDNKNAISGTATVSVVVNPVNDAPVISGQRALAVDEDQSITLQLTDLVVSDPDDTYPTDFTMVLSSGSNYTVFGNTITPSPNFFGILSVPVKVNDGDLDNVAIFNIQITVNPINDSPSFDPITDIIISENASQQTITVTTISAGPLETQTLLLTATSGNTNLIPSPTVTYNGTGNTATLSFTPVPSQTGTATVTVRVVDNGPSEFTRTFQIQVVSVNDAPTLAAIGTKTMQEDAALENIPLTGISAGPSENQALTITASSSNTTLFEVLDVVYVSPQTTGTLRMQPKANAFGTATVTVTVTDDGPSSPSPSVNTFSRSFTVTVTPVNDAPVITGQQNLSVAEDQSITLQLTNLLVADPDDTYPADFTMVLSGGSNYTLSGNTVTPSGNFFGTLSVPVRVNDGSADNDNTTFKIQITVNPVNDAPTLTAIGTQTMDEDAAVKDISLAGITAGPNENQALTVSTSSTNANLFETLSIVYTSPQTTGTLKVKPKANAFGSATVTVTVADDGPSTPIPNINTIVRTFTVNVSAVNDSPQFTSTPLTVATLGEPFSDSVRVDDIDNPSVVLSAVTKPAWLTFTVGANGKKAKLSGTPPAGSNGKTTIKLQAKDTGVPIVQEYELTVNTRPTVSAFSITTSEDNAASLSSQNFKNAFTDLDGNPLMDVEIVSVPKHGTLQAGDAIIAAGTKIAASALDALKYVPAADYNGKDTLQWKGNDGLIYSLTHTSINFVITPVNDAPVIEVMEEDLLEYSIGTDKMLLTTLFRVTDVDQDSLVRAEIGFRRENYNLYDVLVYTSTPKITGAFDAQTGVLILTGKASLAEYNAAIRSIQYSYLDTEHRPKETDPLKSVYFTLSDGKALSNTVDRSIKLIFTFNELNIVNGFTPNDDMVNDYWEVIHQDEEETDVEYSEKLNDLKDSKITVYNKAGLMVFENTGFDVLWNGKYLNKGELLPADSYFYTIEFKDSKLKSLKKPYKGVVTLLHDKR